jgi:hypothetical protein
VTEITGLSEAIQELHQYLSDRIAPLMVAESMELMVRAPAALAAGEIDLWVSHQDLTAIAPADLLYHAVKKVAMLGELDLIEKEVLRGYVSELSSEVLSYCPESDRELLRQNLARIQVANVPVQVGGPVEKLRRPEAPKTALSAESAAGLRRLALFLERLRPLAEAPVERRSEVASQFVATAAVQSRTADELEEHLAPLREYGIETAVDKLFKTLASTLPGWGTVPGAEGAKGLVGAQVNAMRRIVALGADPAEAARRFREMVQAAAEQFNEGNLGRAVTMYDLAEQLVADKKVEPAVVEALRKGHESLRYERMRKFAERTDMRPMLRKVMAFYPALQPDGLLAQLNGEPRRERRHELLALLEAHEGASRARAYELLKDSVENPAAGVDPFFQMNLVYLLRVIARPADAPIEEEVSVVTRTPGRDSPPPLVKQVIAYLGFTRHEKCERGLITYLRVFENMLLQPETAVYSVADVEMLLDRTCAALARYATPRAWLVLVDHGLKTEVKLGSPTARLVEAGHQDLSTSPELVERLIAALSSELKPRGMLGMFKRNDDRIVWLIQALSGTPTPAVRGLLEEITQRHANETFSEVAAKALASLGAASRPSAPSAGLTGDLDLFGLPGLLQTLSQSHLTGVLSLMNFQGAAQASVLLEQGQFRGAQYKRLKGVHALYQLFEQPFPGTFAFVSRNDVATLPTAAPARDVMGLLLEGVRRHDELKRAVALVPDDAVLKPAVAKGTALEDEEPQLVQVVWEKVATGSTPAQCEALVARDSFRVRSLIAQWVEDGSLKIA